ncbi:MAG: hypothetical protein GY748_22785 [Planctomycetaceae bacterium]|nr:hypothetical protein [Planctomycetaceae bacterium]
MIKNPTEKLAYFVMSQLLPTSNRVVHVEPQSNGEPDFNVFDDHGRKVGIVEATAAIHEKSMRSFKRMEKHGQINCPKLENGWLLMAHNPDPKWISDHACECLATLEKHDLTEFSNQTRFTNNPAVNAAADKLIKKGIENGGHSGTPGSISILRSSGEKPDDWVISPDRVTEVVIQALECPDNLDKLSVTEHGATIDRHFFVEIDKGTQPAAGDSMSHIDPPSIPFDLRARATHIWVAMRLDDIVVVVWCGNSAGWTQHKIMGNGIDERA